MSRAMRAVVDLNEFARRVLAKVSAELPEFKMNVEDVRLAISAQVTTHAQQAWREGEELSFFEETVERQLADATLWLLLLESIQRVHEDWLTFQEVCDLLGVAVDDERISRAELQSALGRIECASTTVDGRTYYSARAVACREIRRGKLRHKEFLSFDEVLDRWQSECRDAGLDIGIRVLESLLKRLVSESEIRAFREGEQMKFRLADINNLSKAPEILCVTNWVTVEEALAEICSDITRRGWVPDEAKIRAQLDERIAQDRVRHGLVGGVCKLDVDRIWIDDFIPNSTLGRQPDADPDPEDEVEWSDREPDSDVGANATVAATSGTQSLGNTAATENVAPQRKVNTATLVICLSLAALVGWIGLKLLGVL